MEVFKTIAGLITQVVASDFKDFRNKANPWLTFDLDEDVERLCDVRLDGPIWHFDTALQDASRETRDALSSGICVDRRDCAAVSCIEELEKFEGFAAANLAQDNAVGSVTEGRL